MRVFIDGNDGVGKTTLVENLRKIGVDAYDRGWLSKKTLDDSVQPEKDSITILLDAPVEVSLNRLKRRGANMSEEYHTRESLAFFRGIYASLAERHGVPKVSALDEKQTLKDVLHEIWELLPIFKQGESKILKDLGSVFLVKLIPSVYSYTHNRCANIPETEVERLRCHKRIVKLLRDNGIDHAHTFIDEVDNLIVSKYVEPHPPMIETVVKAVHTGTPKHRYYGMYSPNQRYPKEYVRFDWRNPLRHPDTGERLADEVLCDELADQFCDTAKCRKTARDMWNVLKAFLAEKGIDIWDICFMMSEDGLCFSEISQDCMRAKPSDGSDTDKDCFRKGSSETTVLANYKKFNRLIGV